jgi:hypothetical protein
MLFVGTILLKFVGVGSHFVCLVLSLPPNPACQPGFVVKECDFWIEAPSLWLVKLDFSFAWVSFSPLI